MTFFTRIRCLEAKGKCEGGDKGKGKDQSGNDVYTEIEIYIDAFYNNDFLHGYFTDTT